MRVDEGSGKEFRVQWTDEENRLVAERAAAYLRAGVDKTMISAIRRAQEQLLPPKRQRPHMQSRANVPKCAAIIEELLAAPTAPPADTTPRQAEVQAETPPVAAPTEAPTEAPAATPPTPVGELSDQVRLTLHPTANGTNHPPHEPPLGTLSGDADYDDHDRHHEPVEIEDYVPGGRYIPELPPLPSRDQLIDAGAGFIEELFMASAKRILTNPEVGRWLQGFMNRQLPNLVQEDATKPSPRSTTRHLSARRRVQCPRWSCAVLSRSTSTGFATRSTGACKSTSSTTVAAVAVPACSSFATSSQGRRLLCSQSRQPVMRTSASQSRWGCAPCELAAPPKPCKRHWPT
jgi:hypothetical protein